MARFEIANTGFSDLTSSANAETLYEFGLVYATGRDGEEDMVAAHKWLNIAAFRGVEAAKARREEIAVEMTKEQISKAQRAAREWLTQH